MMFIGAAKIVYFTLMLAIAASTAVNIHYKHSLHVYFNAVVSVLQMATPPGTEHGGIQARAPEPADPGNWVRTGFGWVRVITYLTL